MEEYKGTEMQEQEAAAMETAGANEVAPRSIEVITAEIWLYKQQAGAAILEIGRRLNEAKAQLSHGEWLPWLEEKVEFSEVTAQRFMRLAREYENPSLVTDLGASKALQLLALPASERGEFIAEKHEVNGQEKTVMEMSKRELAQAIKERDEARQKAEELEKTMEEQLEEQRTVYDTDMAEVQGRLEEAENRAAGYAKKLEDAKAKAAADLEKAQEDIDSLKAELMEWMTAHPGFAPTSYGRKATLRTSLRRTTNWANLVKDHNLTDLVGDYTVEKETTTLSITKEKQQ